jgi:hypothetical protein
MPEEQIIPSTEEIKTEDQPSLFTQAKADVPVDGGSDTTTDQTPKQEGSDDKPKEEAQPVGAPEKYEDFKLPEGMPVNKEMTEGFKSVAKKLNLTQSQAQDLVDFSAKQSTA